MPKLHVTHLSVGLAKGGAETMLYQVVTRSSKEKFEHRVISLGASSYYEELLREHGIEVMVLPFGRKPLSSFAKLVKLLKQQTDVLSCWMYHANLVGYYAGKLAGVKRIIWNVRHSNLSKEVNKPRTLAIVKWCAKRSAKVERIAYNGVKAREVHESIGYCHNTGTIMINGVDVKDYSHSGSAKASLCEELGIDTNKQLVMSVAKNHPLKDLPTFIKAFAQAHQALPETVAVMCGNGVEGTDAALAALCNESGLQVGKDVYLIGMRHDVPRLLSASNLYVLHSVGEAFPNTLVQAMACECLCVATDVGDSASILNSAEFVVPPQETAVLAERMIAALRLPQEEARTIGAKNRARVLAEYDISNVIRNYEALYEWGLLR